MGSQRVGHSLATEQQQVTSLKTSRKVLAISSFVILNLSFYITDFYFLISFIASSFLH